MDEVVVHYLPNPATHTALCGVDTSVTGTWFRYVWYRDKPMGEGQSMCPQCVAILGA